MEENHNDEIIIINSYLNTEFKINLAIECIKQVKKSGIELLVTSHYNIPQEIIDIVDYCVYDSKNNIITEASDIFWYKNGLGNEFYKYSNLSSHSYSALTSLKNGLFLAKSKGKKYFHHLEYDTILTDENIEDLKGFKSSLNDKLGKLDLCTLDSEHRGISMLYVFSEIDFFIDCIDLPLTKDEYVKYCYNTTGMIASESYLYHKLHTYFSNYDLSERINDTISFLQNDTTALSGHENIEFFHECDITKDLNSDDFYFVYINRSQKNQILEYNGNMMTLYPMTMFYDKVNDDVSFKIHTYNNKVMEKRLDFVETTKNRNHSTEYIKI